MPTRISGESTRSSASAVLGAAQEADATAVQALGERLRRMTIALTR